MSISGSMSNAISGLTAASRSAGVISSNIANALTDGYGRRELQVSANQVGNSGQGVKVNGVSRDVDQLLIAERRVAEASSADLDTRASFLSRLEAAIGTPEDGSSLSGRVSALDSALIAAASQPSSDVRLQDVANTASALANTFQTISSTIQTGRLNADSQIATDVDTVNRALVAVAELNRSITSLSSGSRDSSALLDQRQQLIDQISTIIPVQELPRGNGQVSLMTAGGTFLLDGTAAKLEFTSVGTIAPDMTQASGGLFGLTINGRAVNTGSNGPLSGGSMGAQFAIRDELATSAQTELDAMARDLITRFQELDPDPLRLGLFTDRGDTFTDDIALMETQEIGISARINLNAAVDPAEGGELWRLRDGLYATPGPVGESALFTSMQAALNETREIESGQFAGSSRSLSGFSGQLLSAAATERLSVELEAGFAAARTNTLKGLELEGGVDTDSELQDLLLVEQAYAANAKVIQTADDMIQILLGM
ncbi:flagellar hook-associated protein FlgK [Pseudorhodobacter turbinis]|uniref:Flagellar hook-associated protein 1 n=1 Tax=Pseudorhodobacter turbinis TaxID=2500533 RepID=A0A4P8EH92_9RHOB|nr:flagellar hook-associated protein FlgK [Pseudorhodobacter turbinis]QCO55915.1 flagellar hook-associated protein FlgK [Pseudorhodobacter turbinis]